MKVHVPNKKSEVAKSAEIAFKNFFTNYKSGDFTALGEICNSICVLKEYYTSPHFKSDRVHIITYINKVFDKHIVLILSNGVRRHSYTSNYIVKFIRGEAKHGDSDNRDDKRVVLHNFIFEITSEYYFEYGITANWIIGPNIRADTGNYDSDSCFVHEIQLENGKQKLTFIESLIFHVAYEFWQTCTKQSPIWQQKCLIKFNPNDYMYIWGKDVVDNINGQYSYWIDNLNSWKSS